MARALQIPPEDPYVLAFETDWCFCPVCGIGLGQSEFETPESEYYCPFCGTRQRPAILLVNDYERPSAGNP